MCVICIKKRGVKYPSVKNVKEMCEYNSDGFSIVASCGGKPVIYKTMDMKEFISFYEELIKSCDYRKTNMYIHARIATHGTKKLSNCHGWRSDGLVFAHNGVLSIANRDDMTDSETFFRDIFIPIYRGGGWKAGERSIDAVIGSSKFAFMDRIGEIHHYGKYIEKNGLLYSNLNHEFVSKGYCHSSGSYGKWGYNYWDRSRSSFMDDEEVKEWRKAYLEASV